MKSHQVEYRMIQRLRFLGYILLFFCIGAVAYGTLSYFFVREEEQIEGIIQSELEELPPISPWLVATIFAGVGIGCLWVVKGKQKKLPSKDDSSNTP